MKVPPVPRYINKYEKFYHIFHFSSHSSQVIFTVAVICEKNSFLHISSLPMLCIQGLDHLLDTVRQLLPLGLWQPEVDQPRGEREDAKDCKLKVRMMVTQQDYEGGQDTSHPATQNIIIT